jgi:predicted Fe-Mo cluster-binding NifX family protein
MRIAVACSGKEPDSSVSGMAGRSPYYLIFNEKGEVLETIKNPFAVGGGGAGWGVAKMLADKGVEVVLAGSFGGNMTAALEQRGIKFMESAGSAKEAAKSVKG